MKAISDENSSINIASEENGSSVPIACDRDGKTISVLSAIFYVLLLFFPFGVSICTGLVNLFSDWTWLFEEHDKAFYFQAEYNDIPKALFLYVAVFLVMSLAAGIVAVRERKLQTQRSRMRKTTIAVVLFLFCIVARSSLLVVYWGEVFPSTPYSDFAKSWARAIGDLSSLDYYRFFPGYINFSTIERWIANASNSLYEAVICFCVFCNSLTAVFLFLLADEIFKNRALSFFASAAYILNPTSIAYTITSTPEHLAIACFTGSVYFICLAMKAKKVHFRFALLFVAGLLGGLGDSVKTFYPTIIIAYSIVLILSMFRKDQRNIWARIGIAFLSVLILFGTKTLVVDWITSVSEKEFQVELSFDDATPHYLNVGLNRQGEGQIHVGELSRLYLQDRTDGLPLEDAKANATERVTKDWEAHKDEVTFFLIKKTIWGWQDDYVPLMYFLYKTGFDFDTTREVKLYEQIETFGPTFTQIWYLFSMILGFLGTSIVLLRSKKGKRDLKFMFTNLIIFGYFCLLMISEAQSRYKCLILPFVCLIDSYAVSFFIGSVRAKKKRELSSNP